MKKFYISPISESHAILSTTMLMVSGGAQTLKFGQSTSSGHIIIPE